MTQKWSTENQLLIAFWCVLKDSKIILILTRYSSSFYIIFKGVYQMFIYPMDRVRFMVFKYTFNNISVISWWSVLLLEETRVPGENYRPAACHWQTLSHNVVSSTPRHEQGCKSNYHRITTAPQYSKVFNRCVFILCSLFSIGCFIVTLRLQNNW